MNKQNKLIKELIQELEQDGVDVSKYKDKLNKINNNLKDKKYGLVWEQHTESLIEELKSKIVGLQEVKERRIFKDEEYTNNFLIEGDNLESLNAMLKSGLEGKVDVIAIDPPYNIFINKKKSGKLTYEDKRVNLEDSYPHSMWLSFMKERLELAKKLLSDKGVIFINIDDTEESNLKLLCDEIYGEDNYISKLIWNKGGGKSDSKYISNRKEYILSYRKSDKLNNFKGKNVDSSSFKLKDDKGLYKLRGFGMKGLRYSKSLDYPIKAPDGSYIYPGESKELYDIRKTGDYDDRDWCWTLSEKEFNRRLCNGDIEFKKIKGIWKVYYKQRYVENKMTPYGDIIQDVGTNTEGSKEILDIFNRRIFDYPKPVSLIKHLISLYPDKNATILDFFAGSGTTGHAVLELNKEDGGNRQFILCTNNENNICEDITYQRLNKVINGYTTPKGKEVEGIPTNLTYLKTELVDKEDSDFIFYDKSHLEYLKNLLKLRYSISEDDDIDVKSESLLTVLKGKDKDVYIYLNDYVDLEDFKAIELNKEKESIIYVDNSLVNDLNLTKKGFKEIKKVNHYFN